MNFDYEGKTLEAYKNDQVAKVYHDAFANDRGVRSIRFRFVASREVAVVRKFLKKINHQHIIDIPAGTGKLACMFVRLGSSVLACDISENMLNIAKQVYSKLNYEKVIFKICDATKLSSYFFDSVDAIVCLRLMHRVPADVRKKMLSELANVSQYAIISYGVETIFHRYRRKFRAFLLGGGSDALSYSSIKSIRDELSNNFIIISEQDVIPLLSQERIFLVRVR